MVGPKLKHKQTHVSTYAHTHQECDAFFSYYIVGEIDV